jgi:hypothetical protein
MEITDPAHLIKISAVPGEGEEWPVIPGAPAGQMQPESVEAQFEIRNSVVETVQVTAKGHRVYNGSVSRDSHYVSTYPGDAVPEELKAIVLEMTLRVAEEGPAAYEASDLVRHRVNQEISEIITHHRSNGPILAADITDLQRELHHFMDRTVENALGEGIRKGKAQVAAEVSSFLTSHRIL